MPYSITKGSRGIVAKVEGDLTVADIESLRQARAESLQLSMPTWSGRGLELLSGASGVTRVRVVAYAPVDLSSLADCGALGEVSVFGVPSGTLDLARLPVLTGLHVHLQSGGKLKLRNLDRATQLLEVEGNLSAKQLEELGALIALQRLFLSKSKIESLAFLERLSELVAISMDRCSEVRDIASLSSMDKLEFVRFRGSRRITDHECLTPLRNLTTLALDECGEIPSLAFIQGFSRLASLSFSGDTCIKDGAIKQLHSLSGLGYVNFVDRPHYDSVRAEFPFDRSVAEERFEHYRPLVSGPL